ncbi:RHS repeat domain-containing protein [Tenacibaculum maritimum]|uniref:Rhs family protein n=1 Tax=Tenacibaculum maritimum NCIMB 2154 TaxID=1349785 RepID=A0A2H1E7G5_9FLAO|nr:RHS repeat-associated core domain-containing protein [Tenacibaculum maritimum]SFZ80890.1 protein of unknown function [Tenacibaculum maritimum NCIMB 2154]
MLYGNIGLSNKFRIAIQAYDARGNIVWECELDIYGKVRNLHGEKTFIPFRFSGQYEDIETGLYYNRFRYYSPDTGTYISKDPIGLLGNNPNLYAYVPDVNSWVDVFGLDCGKKIYRGTDNGLEKAIAEETGYIMSDAAKKYYMEAMYSGMSKNKAISNALEASKKAHKTNIEYFGSLENYMKAHSLKGTEIGGAAERSLISFTTDPSVTSRFGSDVFKASKSDIFSKTLVGGSESEVFVAHMVKVF